MSPAAAFTAIPLFVANLSLIIPLFRRCFLAVMAAVNAAVPHRKNALLQAVEEN
jgi:hypothetical protein